jgi:hypothetical protein
LVKAIADCDAAGATKLMDSHIGRVEQQFLTSAEPEGAKHE